VSQPGWLRGRVTGSRWRAWALRAWPILLVLAILWFPFDWLATVWPAFGVPFRVVFRNAHDHFVGHTIFFLLVGLIVLAYVPRLRRLPLVYLTGLVAAALVQETVQAIVRGQAPTYTDFNAFKGDALGGTLAFAVWAGIEAVRRLRERRKRMDTAR
jgi:hypothetical protein